MVRNNSNHWFTQTQNEEAWALLFFTLKLIKSEFCSMLFLLFFFVSTVEQSCWFYSDDRKKSRSCIQLFVLSLWWFDFKFLYFCKLTDQHITLTVDDENTIISPGVAKKMLEGLQLSMILIIEYSTDIPLINWKIG